MAAGALGASPCRIARGPVGTDLASRFVPSYRISIPFAAGRSDSALGRVASTSLARFSSAIFSRSFFDRNFGYFKRRNISTDYKILSGNPNHTLAAAASASLFFLTRSSTLSGVAVGRFVPQPTFFFFPAGGAGGTSSGGGGADASGGGGGAAESSGGGGGVGGRSTGSGGGAGAEPVTKPSLPMPSIVAMNLGLEDGEVEMVS